LTRCSQNYSDCCALVHITVTSSGTDTDCVCIFRLWRHQRNWTVSRRNPWRWYGRGYKPPPSSRPQRTVAMQSGSPGRYPSVRRASRLNSTRYVYSYLRTCLRCSSIPWEACHVILHVPLSVWLLRLWLS